MTIDSKPDSNRIVIIDVPTVITAKIVRPRRAFSLRLPQLHWLPFRRYVLLLSLFLAVLCLWSLIWQRWFWHELIFVGLVTSLGMLGFKLAFPEQSSKAKRALGCGMLLLAIGGLTILCLPAVQRGFARCELVQRLRREGCNVEVQNERVGQSMGWLRVGRQTFVPMGLVNLAGGPAMFNPIEHAEIPSDMLTQSLARTLYDPVANATRVSLTASKSQRPPDLAGLQQLFKTSNLFYTDMTWFDAASCQVVQNSGSFFLYGLAFDGRLSSESVSVIDTFAKTRVVHVTFANMSAEDLKHLSALPDKPSDNSLFTRQLQISLVDCNVDEEVAKTLANKDCQIVAKSSNETTALLAKHGCHFWYVSWQGKMTREQAASLAGNMYVQSLYGTVSFEPGALEVLSKSIAITSIPTITSPVSSQDLEYLFNMPRLGNVSIDHCVADFEALQKLAQHPTLKAIRINRGSFKPEQLVQLNRDASKNGTAMVSQSIYEPASNEPSVPSDRANTKSTDGTDPSPAAK